MASPGPVDRADGRDQRGDEANDARGPHRAPDVRGPRCPTGPFAGFTGARGAITGVLEPLPPLCRSATADVGVAPGGRRQRARPEGGVRPSAENRRAPALDAHPAFAVPSDRSGQGCRLRGAADGGQVVGVWLWSTSKPIRCLPARSRVLLFRTSAPPRPGHRPGRCPRWRDPRPPVRARLPCPSHGRAPVAPSDPNSSARTRLTEGSRPSPSRRRTKRRAARIGPTVWEEEGPMPTGYRSKSLSAVRGSRGRGTRSSRR